MKKTKIKVIKGVALRNEARKLIPGGNQLLLKRSEMFLPGQRPRNDKKRTGYVKKKNSQYRKETKAVQSQQRHWEALYQLFHKRPMTDEELMVNLGLYMRSSALAKILFLNEAYGLIREIPGSTVEFGTWLGQNLVVFENLRAIYEPFNHTRHIIGFDTFTGYPALSKKDRAGPVITVGGYKTPADYREYLERVLDWHEKNNLLANIKKHQTIEGDVCETVPPFFKNNPALVVALAYFDLALYEPTKVCLQTIKDRLIPGSVVMLDEFNWSDYPGETIAFREVFWENHFTIKRSQFIADRTFVIMR